MGIAKEIQIAVSNAPHSKAISLRTIKKYYRQLSPRPLGVANLESAEILIRTC